MATIQKRGDSYSIRVSCGYDSKGKHVIQSMTWESEPKMTAKQIEKELNRQTVMFEESVNRGLRTSAIKFQELAEEWFENYAKNNLRSTTYERIKQLTHRIYPAIKLRQWQAKRPLRYLTFTSPTTQKGRSSYGIKKLPDNGKSLSESLAYDDPYGNRKSPTHLSDFQ